MAGGGTGGHVVPALAIGAALVEKGHAPEEVLFVGSERGIEVRMVPAAGFELVALPGRGIARRLTIDNVGAVAGLLVAFVRATVLVRRSRPAVVVVVGGYASAPAAFAAALWRVPLVVAEQNAVPGLANRIAGRFAAASAVSFEGTPLPRAVLTGNPVRTEVVSADTSPEGRAAARRALGLPVDRMVVAVAGGSLGARRINDAVLALASLWADRDDVCLYHVTGRRDFEALVAAKPAAVKAGSVPNGRSGSVPNGRSGLDYRQIEFEDRMPLLLAAADVTVQRAGASSVAEIAVAGIPSILVPLPGAPGDHQTKNAQRLADAGAAVLVPDAELDGDRLAAELQRLLGAEASRRKMAEAARAMGRPDAAARVADLVEAHARGARSA